MANLPETAALAVAAYDAGQQLDAVVVHGAAADQPAFWRDVFGILRVFPMPAPGARFTYSLGQFAAWCFEKKLAQFPMASGVISAEEQKRVATLRQRAEAIQGAAYAILREGYRNVVERRAPNVAARIQIKKS